MKTETEIDDGGPAFACAGISGLPNGEWLYGNNGMSLRDYFAAAALQGLLADSTKVRCFSTAEGAADVAYQFADAMIAARKEGGANE